MVEIDILEPRLQNLAVAHGRVQSEYDEKPAIRISVGNCRRQESVALLVIEGDRASAAFAQFRNAGRFGGDPIDRAIEEMGERRQFAIDGPILGASVAALLLVSVQIDSGHGGGVMAVRHREEVLNTVLATVLIARGMNASPESIKRKGAERPDVLIYFRGLRCAIEGKIADVQNAREVVAADAHEILNAMRRVHETLATDDAVRKAAEELSVGLTEIANVFTNDGAVCDRLIDLLGIGSQEADDDDSN